MMTVLAQSLHKQLSDAKSHSEVATAMLRFLEEHGNVKYDEVVTQLEHALQSAYWAASEGLGPFAVTAALFHDVGHLLVGEFDEGSGFLHDDLNHEDIGANFLSTYFPDSVTEPIRMHVISKRYLCTVESDYHDSLSPASQRTYRLQGGRLNEQEIRELQANPNLEIALAVRRIDDKSKTANKVVPGVEAYVDTVASVLLEK